MLHLRKQLESMDFEIVRSSCASDDVSKSAFIFLLESRVLPDYFIRIGPTVHMEADIAKFLERNIRRSLLLWTGNDDRVLAIQNRRFIKIESALENILRQDVKSSGVAPGLKSYVSANHKIYSAKLVLKPAAEHKWLSEEMQKLVNTNGFSFSVH